MTNLGLKKALFWICLIIAPAVLLSIELFHPAGFTHNPGMFDYLSVSHSGEQHNALGYFGPGWWFTLHMIQTPTVGLVVIGLIMLVWTVKKEDGLIAYLAALASMVASFLTIIYFTVLDGIGGIGLGRTLSITNEMEASGQLSPEDVKKVAMVLNNTWVDPWVGGVGSFVSHTASWAIFFSTLFVAIALLVSRKVSWPPLVILVASGWEVQVSHASYHGPVGFGLLFVAGIWIWFQSRHKVLGAA